MKKLLILILIFGVSNAFSAEIIIKTNSNTDKNSLKSYLDNTYGYLLRDNEISYLIQNRKIFSNKNNDPRLLNASIRLNQLQNLFVINYSSSVNPVIASQKLATDPNFEFVEKMPKRSLQFVPNDSLYGKQYYLQNINIEEAFSNFQSGEEVLVAVVDTGIEYEHPDLIDNIWQNKGEIGTDSEGNDKRTNGIDDDENGYIDDHEGWDFIAGSGNTDNNPRPGNRHGTHVAGIIGASINNVTGVSGVAMNTKLVAVKIGPDNPNIRSVARGFEAILYAAIIGADIINCSWGGGAYSIAEQQIIEAAQELGSIIIAAAGNNNSDMAFYPAAYNNVISVASTGLSDSKSGFSNYHSTVDISAPGSQIYNTVLNGDYDYLSGTSMASPVVAGLAALVMQSFPDHTPRMIQEQMQATSQPVVNVGNFAGKMGSGLIEVNEAITNQNAKNISLFAYDVKKQDGDKIFQSNDKLDITFVLENILNPIENFKYKLIYDPNISISETAEKQVSNFEVNQKITDIENITLPDSLPLDYNYSLILRAEGDDYQRDFVIPFNVNQSYRNMFSDRIDLTVNSRGNMAFNDYPANEQGIGFNYRNLGNILFEGGMIVSSSSQSISSVVRSASQGVQGRDFETTEVISTEDLFYSSVASSKYSDNALEGKAGVEITKEYMLAKSGELASVVYLKTNIKNISGVNTDSLYLGYYFDWDIGTAGRDNIAEYWAEENLGIQYNVADESLPHVAVALISDGDFIFYPLDNDGESAENPGVYDGFTKKEQWETLTGKIQRDKSSQTDASMVFGAGPYSLEDQQSTEVTFIIMAAESKDDFPELLKKAKDGMELLSVNENTKESNEDYVNIFPNPVSGGNFNLEFLGNSNSPASIKLFDVAGNLVYSNHLEARETSKNIDIPNLVSGNYILEFKNENHTISKRIIIKK